MTACIRIDIALLSNGRFIARKETEFYLNVSFISTILDTFMYRNVIAVYPITAVALQQIMIPVRSMIKLNVSINLS